MRIIAWIMLILKCDAVLKMNSFHARTIYVVCWELWCSCVYVREISSYCFTLFISVSNVSIRNNIMFIRLFASCERDAFWTGSVYTRDNFSFFFSLQFTARYDPWLFWVYACVCLCFCLCLCTCAYIWKQKESLRFWFMMEELIDKKSW